MKKTAIYCRVSTARQEKEGDSIPAQLDALRDYIRQRDDLIPAGEYIDAGISGTKENRDELQRMLDDVKAGKIDLIIVTKLDRLHRSLRNFLNMQSVLEKNHCNWLAIWEPIYDSSTPQGRMIINTMVNLAQFEAENTGSRIKQVFEYKAAQGEVLSGKILFGYCITDKHLTLDPAAAPIVRAIFKEYAQNNSLADAVRLAGDLGRVTDCRSIKRLLRNRKYMGEFRGNVNYCPAIIDKPTFDAVQIALARNIKQSQKRIYIFSGLLVCSECGRRLSATWHTTSRNGKQYHHILYRCAAHFAPVPKCQQGRTISESSVEKAVLAAVKNEVDKITIEQSKPRQNGGGCGALSSGRSAWTAKRTLILFFCKVMVLTAYIHSDIAIYYYNKKRPAPNMTRGILFIMSIRSERRLNRCGIARLHRRFSLFQNNISCRQ